MFSRGVDVGRELDKSLTERERRGGCDIKRKGQEGKAMSTKEMKGSVRRK